jgi:hypothetical protein
MAQFFHLEDESPVTTQAKGVNGPVRQRIAVNHYEIKLSNTPWNIRKEEEDEVMNMVGFHRKDYDLAVTSFHNEKGFPSMPPGYSERHEPPARKRRKRQDENLRLATCFPVEIMHTILQHTSFKALCCFRLTNSYSKDVVEDMPEFQTLLEYGSTAARAALETRCAARYSISHMMSILRDPHCWHCGEFGNWVYLPWFVRTCFDHFDSEQRDGMYSRIKLLRTIRETGELMMSRREDKLIVKVVPGKYGLDQTEVEENTWVLAPNPPDRKHWYEGPNGEFEDDDVVFLPDRWPFDGRDGKGHYASQKAYVVRLATAAPFPYVDPTTRFVVRGLSCSGCNSSRLTNPTKTPWVCWDDMPWPWHEIPGNPTSVMNHVWSRKGFLAHVRVCKEAQRVWKQRNNGVIRKVTEGDTFVEKGGYFAEYGEGIPVAVKYVSAIRYSIVQTRTDAQLPIGNVSGIPISIRCQRT